MNRCSRAFLCSAVIGIVSMGNQWYSGLIWSKLCQKPYESMFNGWYNVELRFRLLLIHGLSGDISHIINDHTLFCVCQSPNQTSGLK